MNFFAHLVTLVTESWCFQARKWQKRKKKKNTGKFNYSSSANQGCNQHVNMFKRIDFAELRRSVNMIKWHFMVILVNLSSKFPFDISRLWVDQSWKKWCQLSLHSSVRPCILNQFSNRKWLIYLNLKLKKKTRTTSISCVQDINSIRWLKLA